MESRGHWTQARLTEISRVGSNPGADPGFSFGGGGGGGGAQKIMCLHAHYERGTKLTFGRGPGPLGGPWKL